MSKSSEQVIKKNNLPEHYSGKFTGSFAYITIKDRLPVILVKVVDFLCQHRKSIIQEFGEVASHDTKEIISHLSALQNEMVTNKKIKLLDSEGPDVRLWNEYLEQQEETYGSPPTWFESPWLYAECYLYRRMKQAFDKSQALKGFDPFHKQKEDSLQSLMESVTYICSVLQSTLRELECNKVKTFDQFRTYLELSLWGNKCDLSISAGKENIVHSNPLKQLKELRRSILANDTQSIWQLLQEKSKSSSNIQIDFVLDNAGFELFCDLCFIQYLQAAGFAQKIVLHVKAMPWFVSDTMEHDIGSLLKTLAESHNDTLVRFSRSCSERFNNQQWLVRSETFWTLPHDYSEMQDSDPNLYDTLRKSDLVIFKGDLNYRKLTGDRQWHETTPFLEALNNFLPTSLATLRTIKADVVVGLKPGTCDAIVKHSENWKFVGDYAVIQSVIK